MIPSQFIYDEDVYCDDVFLNEEWEYILHFLDYRISNMGRVWSCRSDGFLKPSLMNGYHFGVHLFNSDGRHPKYIHRLVAEAFLSNPYGYPMVRHLDDDPSNNFVENLEWGIQVDNRRDMLLNGNSNGCPRVKVRATDAGGYSEIFESQHHASRILGVSVAGISKWADSNRPLKGFLFERIP